jgi:hypothetical protein
MISAAVRSGTVGSSPARLRTARTSLAERARCSCPERDPFEVNANTCSHHREESATPSTMPRVSTAASRPKQLLRQPGGFAGFLREAVEQHLLGATGRGEPRPEPAAA